MSWIILAVAILLEVVTSTFPLLLLLFPLSSNTPYIVFGVSSYPRIIGFLVISIMLQPKKWWIQYIKIDVLLLGVVSSSISYIYLIAAAIPKGDPLGWKVHACILYPLLFVALVGNFRCMLKYFPWNGSRVMIFWYKLNRFYAPIVFTISSLVLEALSVNRAAISYFGTTLSLLIFMFVDVLGKEEAVYQEWKKMKKHLGEPLMPTNPV